MSRTMTRKITLRREVNGRDVRNLWAYLDEQGRLHIDGQDLGPGTAIASEDGEYEWYRTYEAAEVPRIIALLDGQPGDDLLDLVERYAGDRSYELEQLLRESGIPSQLQVW